MPRRPDVLFVMTDHTTARAAAPASPCLTPTLDRLAAEGVRFARAYTTNAICSPARASLVTATYPSTHGVWDCTHTQPAGWIRLAGNLEHWASRLADAGYATGYFGKWHVEPDGDPTRFGFQEADTTCGRARLAALPGTEVVQKTPGYPDYLLAAAGDDSARPVRHPAVERGIDFLRRHAPDERPFCCFVSALEPHDPYIPPRSVLERYDIASAPLSPTLREEPRGKPELLRRMRAVWGDLADDDWRRITACYRAVVSFLDDELGRLLETLRALGRYDNTLVVFTSDHGDMVGGHGLATKGIGTAYEEVYNIPLVVRPPGGGPGREEPHAVVSLVDVGPTILDYADLPPLATAQGRSFRGLVDGSDDPAGWQDAYAEFYGQRFVYTQRVVWHGRWKYVFNPGGIDELYDLAADPHERHNRADDPACREVLQQMCGRMWRKMRDIGDESLFRTHYATLRTAPVGPGGIDPPGAP